jgi:hypothetical protein
VSSYGRDRFDRQDGAQKSGSKLMLVFRPLRTTDRFEITDFMNASAVGRPPQLQMLNIYSSKRWPYAVINNGGQRSPHLSDILFPIVKKIVARG